MSGTENLCWAFPWMFIAAGLWRLAKRLPSPISEHSGVGGFDAYTKSKHSRVRASIFIHEQDKNCLAKSTF